MQQDDKSTLHVNRAGIALLDSAPARRQSRTYPGRRLAPSANSRQVGLWDEWLQLPTLLFSVLGLETDIPVSVISL
jgi:hypothetical protein